MKIKLNKEKYTIIDDIDFDLIKNYTWYFSDTGYARATIWKNNKTGHVRMHRIILNAKGGEFVDHINNNKLDNRRSNLRICTNAENMRNRKAPKNNITGFKGVRMDKRNGHWTARIKVFYKEKYLGVYKTREEAAIAYNLAALKYFRQFALLNKI